RPARGRVKARALYSPAQATRLPPRSAARRFRRQESAMTEAHLFAVGVLLAWLAGIRAYLTVFGVGLAGVLGWLDLPPALEATTSPWVLGVSGALALAEFFADKIPGVDSAWDLLQTLARVPAGAF